MAKTNIWQNYKSCMFSKIVFAFVQLVNGIAIFHQQELLRKTNLVSDDKSCEATFLICHILYYQFEEPSIQNVKKWYRSKLDTFTRCWVDDEPPSTTLAQHQPITGWVCGVCWDLLEKYDVTKAVWFHSFTDAFVPTVVPVSFIFKSGKSVAMA